MKLDTAIAGAALMGAAFAGFAGGSTWAIPAAAVTLAALRTDEHAEFAERYTPVGQAKIWALFFAATYANRIAWAALAFAAGKAATAIA